VSTATTTRGRRRAPSRWAGWSRGRRSSVVAVVLLVILAVVAVALALFRAPIGGSVDSSDTGLRWNTAGATSAAGDGADCGLTIASASLANLTMDNAYAGATCTFTGIVQAKAGADESVVLVGLTLAPLPAGWTAELDPEYCGDVVSDGPGAVVGFTVTMTETAAVGSGSTLDAQASGVEAVPESQYDTALCS
jgi:hypothetical protein